MTDQRKPPGAIGTGYPGFMLAKALITAEGHADRETRELAQAKVKKWAQTINAMISDEVSVGSREPVKDVPKWVTLEVITGGFATGSLLAGGELQAHEQVLLDELELPRDDNFRLNLNCYFLTEAGLGLLMAMLDSGNFQVNVPEEGALLTVAWLAGNNEIEAARELIDTISPLMDRLRFYPVPGEGSGSNGFSVCLQPVKAAVAALKRIRPNERVLAQREAVLVWAPLYDKMVGLFIETVESVPPHLAGDGCEACGEKVYEPGEVRPVEGGWPCYIYPKGWRERAAQALDEYDQLRLVHRHSTKPDNPKSSFYQIRNYLRKCVVFQIRKYLRKPVEQPEALTKQELARLRLIIARYVFKRGTPDSDQCSNMREKQAGPCRAPLHKDIAEVVLARLSVFPPDKGLADVQSVSLPVTETEAGKHGVAKWTKIPPSQIKKVQRSRIDTVDALIDDSVITSGETLARVLPQVTSELKSIGIADRQLRRLYAAVYRAFRQRRSLLLVDYQSQVKLEELPWVSAIDRFRESGLEKQEVVRQTLEEVTVTVLTAFPQMILPNKLIQEFDALACGAGLELPLTEEVAADIFMGGFTVKYRDAAQVAGMLLCGTLYDRYYAIDYRGIMPVLGGEVPAAGTEPRLGFLHWLFSQPKSVTGKFSALCAERSGVSPQSGVPAQNGMVIEQQLILTTHNLAVLYFALDLEGRLAGRLVDLAKRCLKWVCWRLTIKVPGFHAKLVSLKNAAYAWRQLVFFLALATEDEQRAFISWAKEYLREQSPEFHEAFQPALNGLALAVNGMDATQFGLADTDARVFLGWSVERHWFLDSGCI